MRQLKPEDFNYMECDRCGVEDDIHITTDGHFNLCDLCARKMTFDREHPND